MECLQDAPAWIVSKANEWARAHGKTPFSIYQGAWSVLDRSFERDIIPMARSEGLALAPWGVVGGGRIRTDEEEERRRQTGENGRLVVTSTWERSENQKKISRKLEEVAKEVGAKTIQAVAIAYVMHVSRYWKVYFALVITLASPSLQESAICFPHHWWS